MSAKIDLTGKRFGRLVAIKHVKDTENYNNSGWLCKCDCGATKVIRSRNLRAGTTKSCAMCGYAATIMTKHNHASGGKITPTYKSWQGMIQRCNDPNHPMYSRYGGRGISVSPNWLTFNGFLLDMGERPNGRTLDRINNDGNYELENCRWASPEEQQRNRSTAIYVDVDGKRRHLKEISAESGRLYQTVWRWHKEGVLRERLGYLNKAE